jgi:benzylsuccinate CoA-transferase BbsF subunit
MAKQALEGLRILEIGIAYATPYATKLLADMGAEVIKVESHTRLDTVRVGPLPDNRVGERFWDESCWYQATNPNKLGITLNLNTEDGVLLVKELVKVSDVVVENFAPRVMANLGLDYPSLKEVKQDIVMLSSSGYGHTGPWRDYVVYGWALEPMTISHLTGYEEGGPFATPVPYTDVPAALYGAFSVLAALEHRDKTGEGQWIDLSQYELGVCAVGEAVLDYTVNGRVQTRIGNHHPLMAPHNCFPCKGKDRWIAICVFTDDEWQALCREMGNPEWALDKRFDDAAGRLQHQKDLDDRLGKWTASFDPMALMQRLQKAGVPAGVALNNKELLLNPHMKERGYFQKAKSPSAGTRLYPGPWFRLSNTPGRIRKSAPNLGQDNQQILTGLLGLTEADLADLEVKGVIGTAPPFETEEEKAAAIPTVLPLDLQVQLGLLAGYDEDFYELLGLPKDGES